MVLDTFGIPLSCRRMHSERNQHCDNCPVAATARVRQFRAFVRQKYRPVTQDEIRAIIHVIGIYCGVPQALECFRVARQVLEEN